MDLPKRWTLLVLGQKLKQDTIVRIGNETICKTGKIMASKVSLGIILWDIARRWYSW